MVVTVVIVLVVLAAVAAALFLGPPGLRTSVSGTVGGVSTRVGRFIESGRRPGGGIGAAAAAPRAPRFTDADRAYLDGVWRHVQSTFVTDPRVAVTLAHRTAEGFFDAHGVPTDGLPAGDGAEDTEALRQRLMAIKAWSDRQVAH